MSAQHPMRDAGEGEDVRHQPVLPREVLRYLDPAPGSVVLDCTIGPGGHAGLILDRTSPDGRLIGVDRDPEALREAGAALARFGERAILRQADFREAPALVERLGVLPLDGILADLGVSAMQLLNPARGFSFASDGPLDMRMDPSRGQTALDLIARLDERELARLIGRLGEEPAAPAIARAIARARQRGPVATTRRLAEIVTRAVLWRRGGIHPATRTFMALRIAVNDELSGLDRFIQDAVRLLRPGGRVVVIAFHSLEDRAVKSALRTLAFPCVCPPGLPVCGCGRAPLVRLLTARPVRPDPREVSENPRSRSARLRAAERV